MNSTLIRIKLSITFKIQKMILNMIRHNKTFLLQFIGFSLQLYWLLIKVLYSEIEGGMIVG